MRMVLAVIIALLAGLLGLSFVFSDPGPGESLMWRLAEAALLFFFSGVLTGYLYSRSWRLAGLAAWGAVLLALASLLSAAGEGLTGGELVQLLALLLVPLGLALAGGYLGALLFRMGGLDRLLERLLHEK